MSILTEDILSLKKLKGFTLSSYDHDAQDFVLYKALKQLPHLESLELDLYHITLKGIIELSDTITTSCTLESIDLKCFHDSTSTSDWLLDYRYPLPLEERTIIQLNSLVEAALSCSTGLAFR